MTSVARYCLALLFDHWLAYRLGKAMSVMVPSALVEIIPRRPSTNSKRKLLQHHVVERAYDRSMEDFTAEVRSLFEAPLQHERMLDFSLQLQMEYRERLQSSEISMLPSFQHTLPTGNEKGDFLALDVGGSTFRIALIRVGGKSKVNGGLEVRRIKSFVIDKEIRDLSGHLFFDWMAERIGDMLKAYNNIRGTTNARLEMGLAWSFPVEMTSPRNGKLLAMGKGFRAAQGVEGEDLNELVMQSCRERGLNVDLCAIVNDGPATLLSQAYRDPATRMSLILGTGMNAAVFLPTSALGPQKFGHRPESWHAAAQRVVVNTELSMFGKGILPITRWDEELNTKHCLPDFQPLEYLLTGRYLGEIVRLILMEAITTSGLFGGQVPLKVDEPYAFDTRILAAFEQDQTVNLTNANSILLSAHPMRTPPTLAELEFIREVSQLVSRRAAAYLATSIHALWIMRAELEGLETADSRITVACDGTLVEKYPGFRACCQRHLDSLCQLSGASEGTITLEMAAESSVFGAAVAVSCSDHT